MLQIWNFRWSLTTEVCGVKARGFIKPNFAFMRYLFRENIGVVVLVTKNGQFFLWNFSRASVAVVIWVVEFSKRVYKIVHICFWLKTNTPNRNYCTLWTDKSKSSKMQKKHHFWHWTMTLKVRCLHFFKLTMRTIS